MEKFEQLSIALACVCSIVNVILFRFIVQYQHEAVNLLYKIREQIYLHAKCKYKTKSNQPKQNERIQNNVQNHRGRQRHPF